MQQHIFIRMNWVHFLIAYFLAPLKVPNFLEKENIIQVLIFLKKTYIQNML